MSLQRLREIRNRPFIVAFSGPSSSGKSTLIEKLPNIYEESKSYKSISRSTIKKEEDRYDEIVQFKMLEKAIERDESALKSDSLIVFLDRTPIDGFIYCLKYGFDSSFLKTYYKVATKTVAEYDLVILLNRYVFERDSIRTEFDKKFTDFNDLFRLCFPKGDILVEIQAKEMQQLVKIVTVLINDKVYETLRKVSRKRKNASN